LEDCTVRNNGIMGSFFFGRRETMSPLSTTVSALQAFGQRLGVTAGNIANLNTDGYKKTRAILTEGPHGGVELETQRVDTPGIAYDGSAAGELPVRESSNVALEEEIPQLIVSVYGFKANLKTLKAQDDMLGSLLDTVA
jgi:flagellar basal-body rod protein FlgC